MLTVCTGWSAKGWTEYGQKFAESFHQFWPMSVNLVVWGEEPRDLKMPGRSASFFPLANMPPCTQFLERHLNEPWTHGRQQLPQHWWKPSAIKLGYNWRFDACKFSRQGFIPKFTMALMSKRPDNFLCWLDGDVMTHSPVPVGAIESLMPLDKSIAYLGRGPKHPEIGFQLYRVDWEGFRFVDRFAQIYSSDQLFELSEWHSAWAWQQALKDTGPQHAADLTPGGKGHVWWDSPLRRWTDHLKGDRKKLGRSMERR